MAGDSGYGGMDCSRDRYSSASKSNSFPKKQTGLASFPWRKLQDLQRKIAGRPSFIETEKNSRWMKVQPQQVLFCIVLCILIASICFSVLITYKHLNSSTRISRSNGKYRSIQYGASSQTTQDVKKTKDVTTESVLDVLDSLNDFEKIFYDDPSSLDLEDKSGKIELENLRVESMEAEESLASSGLAESKAQAEVDLMPNLEELTIMKLEEEFEKSKEELINKIKSFGHQAGPVRVEYSKKEGSKSEIKELNETSEMDVKTKKLEPKQPKQKPKRSKKKNPLVKSYSPNVSKRKSLKKEM